MKSPKIEFTNCGYQAEDVSPTMDNARIFTPATAKAIKELQKIRRQVDEIIHMLLREGNTNG